MGSVYGQAHSAWSDPLLWSVWLSSSGTATSLNVDLNFNFNTLFSYFVVHLKNPYTTTQRALNCSYI